MYGIGIWGAGWVASGHLTAYLSQPDCKIVAIGSLSLEEAESLAKRHGVNCTFYTDYHAFLAHPGLDIVSVCTPHQFHAQNTIEAAKAGKHVYVEKPIAVNLADLYAMRDAVKEADVRTVTGFVVRWTPLVASLHDMVKEGIFGDLRVVDIDYWHSRKRPEYFRHRTTGGSALLLGGCHAIDTAMFLTGAQPIEVVARSVQIGAEPDDEYDFDCAELCLVRYTNGIIGRVSAIVKGHMPYQFNIDLIGDRGIVRNNRVFSQGDTEQTGFRTLPQAGPDSGNVVDHPFRGLIRHFVDCITAHVEPDVNIDHAVRVHETCFAALLSEATSRPITLPLNDADQFAIHNLLGPHTIYS